MSKALLAAAAFASLALACASPAAAFGDCNPCYRPAPQYRQVVAPAQYRVVYRTVMVAPSRVVYRHIPAEYGTVQQTVVVAPERVGYQQVCDSCGRVGYRQYVVPAQYGTVERTVMVSRPRVVAETIPGEYATVARTELVAPSQIYLVPVRSCSTCGY